MRLKLHHTPYVSRRITRDLINCDFVEVRKEKHSIEAEVERILERQISAIASEEFASVGGVPAAVNILNSSDQTTQKNILEKLEEEDPELAE